MGRLERALVRRFRSCRTKRRRARREELDYLVGRMKEELKRNEGILQPEELEEYRRALRMYENLDVAER